MIEAKRAGPHHPSRLAEGRERLTWYSSYDQLYTFVIFAAVLFYALAGASVIVLRHRHPEWPRPYRTWGYPVTPVLYVAICVIVR